MRPTYGADRGQFSAAMNAIRLLTCCGALLAVSSSGSADPIERRRPTQAEGDPKDI